MVDHAKCIDCGTRLTTQEYNDNNTKTNNMNGLYCHTCCKKLRVSPCVNTKCSIWTICSKLKPSEILERSLSQILMSLDFIAETYCLEMRIEGKVSVCNDCKIFTHCPKLRK